MYLHSTNRYCLVLGLLILCLFSDAKEFIYGFSTKEEGIYRVMNPYRKSKDVVIVNSSMAYHPVIDFEKNELIIYGQKNSQYHIINKKIPDKKVNINIADTINEKRRFVYNLENSRFRKCWLHDIVNPGSSSKTKIEDYRSNSNTSSKIKLFLYNLGCKASNIKVNLLGCSYSVNLPASSDTILTYMLYDYLNIPVISQRKNYITIESDSQKVAIVKFVIDGLSSKVDQSGFGKHQRFSAHNSNGDNYGNLRYFTFNHNKFHEITYENMQLYSGITLFQNSDSLIKLPINFIEIPDLPPKSDYLIVYNAVFEEMINRVVDCVKSIYPNRRITFVNSQSIYDKFSYSKKSNAAIKKYMHLVKPEYTLLIGDANVNETKDDDLLPTFYHYIKYKNIRIATDYYYCYLNDPLKPEIAVGRLPFKTNEELNNYLLKIQKWQKGKKQGNILLFDYNNYLGNYDGINKMQFDSLKKKREVLNDISKVLKKINPDLIVHSGHGGLEGWHFKWNFGIEEFDKCCPAGMYFNLLDLTCWTGEYAHLTDDSFAEKMLKSKDKGAVSVIGCSSYSPVNSYKHIAKHLLNDYKISSLCKMLNQVKTMLFKEGVINEDEMYIYNYWGIL